MVAAAAGTSKAKDGQAPPAPRTVDELTRRNVDTIARIEAATKVQSRAQRIANAVVRFCGSFTFIWLHLLWFGAWILLNSMPRLVHPLDPFPFTFLTLVVSLEAILLSAFILSSQNQEARLTDRLNKLDLQINLLSEQENTKMLQMLQSIAQHLGVKDLESDPSTAVLEEATQPEHLVAQIERATADR
jgi:uncharacterized membrane protein